MLPSLPPIGCNSPFKTIHCEKRDGSLRDQVVYNGYFRGLGKKLYVYNVLFRGFAVSPRLPSLFHSDGLFNNDSDAARYTSFSVKTIWSHYFFSFWLIAVLNPLKACCRRIRPFHHRNSPIPQAYLNWNKMQRILNFAPSSPLHRSPLCST